MPRRKRRVGPSGTRGSAPSPKRRGKAAAATAGRRSASTAVVRAEKAAGGMRALARKLHVSPSTINRWRREGLSKAGKKKLESFKKERVRTRKQKAKERQIFEELMNLAKSPEIPERKRLPKGRTSEGKRSGPLTLGYRSTRSWNRMLNTTLIDDIEAWMTGVAKRYPIWQAITVTSQYGKGEHRGYKTVMYQVKDKTGEYHPEAGDFAISSSIATKKNTIKQDVISSMRLQLEGLIAAVNLKTFVHSSTVFNYRMKSDYERRQFVTGKRRERRKSWEKRQKKMAKS